MKNVKVSQLQLEFNANYFDGFENYPCLILAMVAIDQGIPMHHVDCDEQLIEFWLKSCQQKGLISINGDKVIMKEPIVVSFADHVNTFVNSEGEVDMIPKPQGKVFGKAPTLRNTTEFNRGDIPEPSQKGKKKKKKKKKKEENKTHDGIPVPSMPSKNRHEKRDIEIFSEEKVVNGIRIQELAMGINSLYGDYAPTKNSHVMDIRERLTHMAERYPNLPSTEKLLEATESYLKKETENHVIYISRASNFVFDISKMESRLVAEAQNMDNSKKDDDADDDQLYMI